MCKSMRGPYKTLKSIKNDFISNEICNYRIVKTMDTHEYYIYDPVDGLPSDASLEEVILPNHYQRLRTDIDAEFDKVDFNTFPDPTDHDTKLINQICIPEFVKKCPQKIVKMLADIVNNYIEHLERIHLHEVNIDEDIVIYSNNYYKGKYICPDGTRKYGKKHSFHIVIRGCYIPNTNVGSQIDDKIFDTMPSYIQEVYDKNLYKNGQQCLRLPNCAKPNKKLYKGQITKNGACLMIPKNTSDEMLSIETILKTTETYVNQIMDDEMNKVTAICKKHFGDIFTFRGYCKANGIFNFYRNCSSFCEHCSRVHDNDNTLFVYCNNTNGKVYVYASCIKSPKKSQLIGNFTSAKKVIPKKTQEETKEKCINEKIKSILTSNKKLKPIDEFSDLVKNTNDQTAYCEPKLRSFDEKSFDTLYVRAPMKMGKTKKVREFINNNYPENDLEPAKIYIVSFRQTFSEEMKRKFPSFDLYNEMTGQINSNRLIIQIESLGRLKRNSAPDLLILDESESIISQLSSGLSSNTNEIYQIFIWLLKYSGKVIAMDALMTNKTFQSIEACRKEKRSIFHYNKYKNATKDKYHLTGDLISLVGTLMICLENGSCAVASSSLNVANGIAQMLTKNTNKKIIVYSSETNPAVKKEHFSNVNTHWKNYDCIIYTPTATAGISFEEHHFDYVFGYFTSESCCIETCIQMLGRVRNVSNNEYYLCFSGMAYNNLYTTEDDIMNHIKYGRKTMQCVNYDDLYQDTEIDKNGNFTIDVEKPKNKIIMWNQINKNKSKMMFIERFIAYLEEFGAKCEFYTQEEFKDVTEYDTDDIKELRTSYSSSCLASKLEKAMSVVESTDITDAKFEEIKIKKENNSIEISDDENLQYSKKYLRNLYHYDGEINLDWYNIYSTHTSKRQYCNLVKILYFDITIDETIQQIADDYKIKYVYGEELPRVQSDNLIMILMIVKLLGIRTLLKNEYYTVTKSQKKNITAFITKHYERICNSCEVNLPRLNKDASFEYLISICSKITKSQIDLSLNIKDSVIVMAQITNKFNIGESADDLKPTIYPKTLDTIEE